MIRFFGRLALATLALTISMSGAACSSAPSSSTEEDVAVSSAAITTTDVMARAEQWVAVKLKYCQAPNGGRDYDAACSTYCSRQTNAQWDPYRSDGSGFVSWAWQLPSQGRVTRTFAPFVVDITHVILAKDLAEGDAVNNNHRMMLFKAWTVPGKTATFLEEPGCSSATPYAHELTSDVTLDGNEITVAWNNDTFTAIRYDKIQPADQPVKGAVDAVACEGLAGWAQDPDSPDAAIKVVLDFDAPTGKPNSGSMEVVASDKRSDLCTAIGSCNHGFSIQVPAGLRDGNAHQVYAYGLDALNGSAALLSSPKSFTCASPTMPIGVKRRVVSAASERDWKIDPLLDVAREPSAAVASLPTGPDLELQPTVVISEDGSASVYVIDGGKRRLVLDVAAWQFAAEKWPATKLLATPLGVDWPKARFVFEGVGDPAVYVLDVAPGQGGAPPVGSPSSGTPTESGSNEGCSVSPNSKSDFVWLLGLAVIGLCVRRRATTAHATWQ